MEVVLLENIKNLGQIGDKVDVKRGYGRNFLIKYGKALIASKPCKPTGALSKSTPQKCTVRVPHSSPPTKV